MNGNGNHGNTRGLGQTLPLTAYLHLPWCVRKCPYCDFNSHEAHGELPFEAYAEALIRDLDFELRDAPATERSLHAVFFGGGTPSLFPAALTARVLDALLARCSASARSRGDGDDIEITLEANPGAADCERFCTLRAAGINRLSIGAQSFDDAMLQTIGRIHSADDARAAVHAARAAGFTNINLDLMYGLPGQQVAGALGDVEHAIALDVPHISAYQLTIEPRTWFYRHPPVLPVHDAVSEMQHRIEQRLADAGYERYEVSAWARDGYRCRHNLNYWRFGDYLGLGAGAHGKTLSEGKTRRRVRCRHPLRFIERAGDARVLDHEEVVVPAALPLEFLMNALRLCEGFAPALFVERTGLPLTCIEAPLMRAVEAGLLERSAERIVASERGFRFLDDLLRMFLPEDRESYEHGGHHVAVPAPLPASPSSAARR